jgi:predicted alpha-1,2-mannosidase
MHRSVKQVLVTGALVVAGACSQKPSAPAQKTIADPAAFADPRMGSGGYGFAYGASYPGASAPNGMARVGPDTEGLYTPLGFLDFSGYWAGDETVLAFTHLHLHGTGAHDYGVLGVMPIPFFDSGKTKSQNYSSHFAKTSEQAEPGYYALTLDNGPIKAEFAAAIHSAYERFTFAPGAASGTVLIDLDRHLTGSIPAATLTLRAADKAIDGELQTQGGMSGGFHLYFSMKFRKGWSSAKVFSHDAPPAEGTSATGTEVGAALTFDTSDGAPVEMQVGLSLISIEGARTNLEAELKNWEFQATRDAVRGQWNNRLKALTVTAPTDERTQRNLAMFYSALHHLYVMPGVYSDVDGTYRYYDQTKKAQGFHFVTDLSLWDTYRTANPLYDLIAPDVALDIVQSLYSMAQISGHYPKWPLATSDSGSMLGSGADIVLADAYAKGIRGFDAAGAFSYLRDAAMDPTLPEGRDRGGRNAQAADYLAHGYVLAAPNVASVSLTCEYSQDDFALSQFARALGKTADADALAARSLGYLHLYDPTSGLLREHTADGQIPPNRFNPSDFFDEQYVESDSYQSQFCVQHDIDAFATTWGGKDKFVAGLTDLFDKTKVERETAERLAAAATPTDDLNFFAINNPPTYYFGGNEPDLHYAYLFAEAGRPDLTQQWIPWVRDHYFAPTPTGLSGNDDGGTMSSWFVFSALGIYPVPGSDLYVVGTPLFPKVEMAVGEGTFTFVARNVSDKNIYIQSVKLNGEPLAAPMLHHADLKAGGSLEFVMGATPSTWGVSH